MKSNEERVQSIVSKAKRYKAERKMTLSRMWMANNITRNII